MFNSQQNNILVIEFLKDLSLSLSIIYLSIYLSISYLSIYLSTYLSARATVQFALPDAGFQMDLQEEKTLDIKSSLGFDEYLRLEFTFLN